MLFASRQEYVLMLAYHRWQQGLEEDWWTWSRVGMVDQSVSVLRVVYEHLVLKAQRTTNQLVFDGSYHIASHLQTSSPSDCLCK